MTERYKNLRRVTALLALSNAALAALKLALGLIFSSLAVFSDGLDSAADVLTVCLMFLGIYLARDPADDDHPYGHQRIESIVSVLLGLAVGVSGAYVLVNGIFGLINTIKFSPAVTVSPLLFAASLLSVAGKLWMYTAAKRASLRFDSAVLLAGAYNYRSDAFTSAAVLVGLAGAFFGLAWLDALAAVGVSALILKTAFGLLRGSFAELTDKSAAPETVEELKQIALSVEGVQAVDELRTRKSGRILFVDIEISVNASLSVGEAHDIAEQVHDSVENTHFRVAHCMVHVNPCNKE